MKSKVLIFIFAGLLPLKAVAEEALVKRESAIQSLELLKLTGGLAFVILLILILSWLVKRLNRAGFGFAGGIKVLACATLGTREKVMLVKAGNRYLLLGVAVGSINTLFDFGEQMPEGFNAENKMSFSELLKSAKGKP